jgi:hypothetical protein
MLPFPRESDRRWPDRLRLRPRKGGPSAPVSSSGGTSGNQPAGSLVTVFSNNAAEDAPGTSPVLTSLLRSRHISRITAGIGGDVAINGRTVDAIASKSIRGPTLLTAISGRLPQRDNEIALGTATLRLVNAHMGSEVRVAVPSPEGGTRASSYKVVGAAAFPPDFGAGGLGTGATFSISGLLAAQCAPGPGRSSCEFHAGGNPNENDLVQATRDQGGRSAL